YSSQDIDGGTRRVGDDQTNGMGRKFLRAYIGGDQGKNSGEEQACAHAERPAWRPGAGGFGFDEHLIAEHWPRFLPARSATSGPRPLEPVTLADAAHPVENTAVFVRPCLRRTAV